jgi:2-polyprenyl-3-methyl-5-hydroxy-6-metoxy-1,4-benzoquinol methylase
MDTPERRAHWHRVYQTKDEREVSWFQESPEISVDLIRRTGVGPDAAILDVGGGASRLVDALLLAGYKSVSVIDLSEKALATAKARLGAQGDRVNWVVADITSWHPPRLYDLWHDRAAFHFLTTEDDQAAYAKAVQEAVPPNGHVIVGTFALDGPERCSGLPIVRHDEVSIGRILGSSFVLRETRRDDHLTPGGSVQHFQFSRFQRRHS